MFTNNAGANLTIEDVKGNISAFVDSKGELTLNNVQMNSKLYIMKNTGRVNISDSELIGEAWGILMRKTQI